MENIAYLEKEVEDFRALLSRERAEHPDPDFAAELQLSNLRAQVQQIEEDLRKAKERRQREVVRWRFMRKDAHGSMPLLSVGSITENLAKALYGAAHYLKSGISGGGPIPQSVIGRMDLQFVGLESGSSTMIISGKLSPDMFGESLLENSLRRFFDLLQAEETEEIADAVSAVGIRSMRRVKDVLETVKEEGYDLEVTWHSASAESTRWEGNRSTIRRLFETLNSFEQVEPEEITVQGKLRGGELKTPRGTGGRFTIISLSDEKTYSGQYARRAESKMRSVRLGQEVRARLEKTAFVNAALEIERTEYTLIDIEPVEE